MLVLAVQLDQARRELLERADGGEVAVDERAAASLRRDFATDDELLAVGGFEDGFDIRRIFASSNEVSRRASAEEQADGFDEHRLAGARFAGQDVQARAELDFDRVDHGQSSDAQEAKHEKKENSNPNIGLTAVSGS